jgi:hypothetical protein
LQQIIVSLNTLSIMANVRISASAQVENAVKREELSVLALRVKLASHFVAVDSPAVAAVRASLSSLLDAGTISEDAFNAAVAAAARKDGLNVPLCSFARVLVVVRKYYRNEFENVVGASLDSVRALLAGGVSAGSYSLRLPLGLVRPDSVMSDFVECSPLAAGASASSVCSALLSLRFVFSFRAAVAAAGAAARSDFFDSLASAFRAGSKLGITLKEMQQYLEQISVSVPASDSADKKRLMRSLSRQRSALASVELRLVVRFPACSDVDTDGSFFFAGVPVAGRIPAKVRKLVAVRARLLSTIATLESLLACC